MLVHISFLTFKSDMSKSDKKILAVKLKKGLEMLSGRIDGLLSVRVENLLLECSTVDVLIVCKFTGKAALDRYNNSPLLFNVQNIFDKTERLDTADFITSE